MSAIYEIAIQQVKSEHERAYPEARAAFLAALGREPGVERDWTFESFFTMPEPDEGTVLVGLTRWSSLEAFGAATRKLMPTATAQALFEKVHMRAFVQVRPADGEPFRLEDHIQGPDNVLEVAVRKPKDGVNEAELLAARDAFFRVVAAQPGFVFDRELVDAQGNRVVLIGWESTSAFMNALGALQTRKEMSAFFGVIDVQAYQAARLRL